MYKLIAIIGTSLFFGGCTITSLDVAKEMQPIYAKDRVVKLEAIKLLSKIDRGGMHITMKNGKVVGISYTEHLDSSVLKEMVKNPSYNVKSGLQESGDFLRSLTNILVPFGAMYYGYRTQVSNNAVIKHRLDTDVKLNENDNNTTRFLYDVTTKSKYPPKYLIKDTNESK